MHRFLLPALAVVAGAAVTVAAEEVALVVDDATTLHTLPQRYGGTNFCALWNGTGASEGTKKAVSQMALKLLRFPGGVPCQWYDWKNPLGTGWTKITPDDAWRLAEAAGAAMVFQTNCAGNKGFDSSGAHQAEWVMAAKAAKVQVAFWEIGNEPELDAPDASKGSQEAVYAWYNAVYAEQAKAIRGADPQAKLMGPASANTWFWWHEHDIERFLAAHGDKKGDGLADAISIHWYPDGGSNAWEATRAAAQGWAPCCDYLMQQIAAYDSRPLPLYVTEWNWGGGDKNVSSYGMANALGSADCVGMFHRTGVSGHTHFCLQHVDHNWGMLASSGEPRPEHWASPTYYALALADRLGEQVLGVKNPVDEGNVLSCYATKDARGGIQLMLINKCERALSATLSFTTFKPTGKEMQAWTLVGANGRIDDQDVVFNESPAPKPWVEDLPPPKTVKVGAALTRELAPFSLTLLSFAGGAGAKADAAGAAQPARPSLAPADRKAVDALTDAAVARTIKRTIAAIAAGAEPTTVVDFRHEPVAGTVQAATDEDVTVKLAVGSIQLPWSRLGTASYQALARGFAHDGAVLQALVDDAALSLAAGQLDQARQAIARARIAAKGADVDSLELLERALDCANSDRAKPSAAKPAAESRSATDAKTASTKTKLTR